MTEPVVVQTTTLSLSLSLSLSSPPVRSRLLASPGARGSVLEEEQRTQALRGKSKRVGRAKSGNSDHST